MEEETKAIQELKVYMMQINKKLILFILMLIGSIILNGCDDTIWVWDSDEIKKAKKAKFELEKKGEQERMDRLFNIISSDNETIILLSYKYSIEEKQLKNLIQEYESQCLLLEKRKTVLMLEYLKDTESQKVPTFEFEFKELFNSISIKYNIQKDKLADLLIDYNLLSQHSK